MPELVSKWHAECLPCKWEQHYDVQQDAIDAAVEHVNARHLDVPGHVRDREYMGHVQMRTVGAVEHPKDAPKPAPHPEFRAAPGDGAANTPAVMEPTPEEESSTGSEE